MNSAVSFRKRKNRAASFTAIIGEDGKLHWVSNQFRPAGQVDGVQYYYASFIDMDKQIAAEQELLRDKQMYDDAAKSARLFIWSYDIETHRAVMMQSGYTLETSRKLGLPQVIEKMPDSLLPFIVPEDRKAFSDAYHSIDAGAPYAECEIRLSDAGAGNEAVRTDCPEKNLRSERKTAFGLLLRTEYYGTETGRGKVQPCL
jgi:hypothetical protein